MNAGEGETVVGFTGFDGNLGVLVPVFLFGGGGRWRGKAALENGEKGGLGSEMEKLQGSRERSRQETETLGDVNKQN